MDFEVNDKQGEFIEEFDDGDGEVVVNIEQELIFTLDDLDIKRRNNRKLIRKLEDANDKIEEMKG